jgi:hypothetical protein
MLYKQEIIDNILKAIDDEPEYPGDMPDYIWNALNGDKDATLKTLRLTVSLTKQAIRNRILKQLKKGAIMNEQTEEIIEDCFGSFCSQCVKDAGCTKAAHGIGCNDRIKPLKYKCKTCMDYNICAFAWKAPLTCSDFKDYPEGVYNGDDIISKKPPIGKSLRKGCPLKP